MRAMDDAVTSVGQAFGHSKNGTAWIEAGEGEPLVLVHGVGMNRAVWGPQIEYLARNYRVIAYDMLGHGDSPLPPEETRLQDLGRQLETLLDELEIERIHLVGHSMGALVALDFALRQPDRVRDLVLLNAVYERSIEQRGAVLERARRLLAEDVEGDLEDTLDRWFGPEQRVIRPERVERVRHWLENVDRVGYARVYDLFARADDEFVGCLSSLAMPALFATGEHDPNSTPEMARHMAAECPRGVLHVVPGQRHMMAFMEPETINSLIAGFLQRSSGGQRDARRSLS